MILSIGYLSLGTIWRALGVVFTVLLLTNVDRSNVVSGFAPDREAPSDQIAASIESEVTCCRRNRLFPSSRRQRLAGKILRRAGKRCKYLRGNIAVHEVS